MRDDAYAMKARMRADLRAAMKNGRRNEAKLIRALLAAIDDAEAPPLQASRTNTDQHRFHDGSAEIERLPLSPARVRAVLLVEIEERERAAAEMRRLERPDRADVLHTEAQIARRYLKRQNSDLPDTGTGRLDPDTG